MNRERIVVEGSREYVRGRESGRAAARGGVAAVAVTAAVK